MLAAIVALALVPTAWTGTVAPPASSGAAGEGGERVILRRILSVPVAAAHPTSVDISLDRNDAAGPPRHTFLRVELIFRTPNMFRAECYAKGALHNHLHRILACRIEGRNNPGVAIGTPGSCTIAGSYGPCGLSQQDQHIHSGNNTVPSTSPDCFYARGGFDVSGHSDVAAQTECFLL
jgi:hypothetical protein